MGAAAADASPLRLRLLDAAAADGKTDSSPLRLRFGAAAADVKAECLVLNSLRLYRARPRALFGFVVVAADPVAAVTA